LGVCECTRANDMRHALCPAEANLDEVMKRFRFNRGYFVGIAVLAAVNLVLFLLLLRPSERHRQPIAESTDVDVSEKIGRARKDQRAQTDPHWFGEFWTDLRRPFGAFANDLRSNLPRGQSAPGEMESTMISAGSTSPDKLLDLDYSAIGAVIRANGGSLPESGEKLSAALEKLGDFAHLSIPFSAVALNSGLMHPRVVIAQRPAFMHRSTRSPSGPQSTPKNSYDSLGNTPANKPDLVGRLYLAANMELRFRDENPRVKSVEFISWNNRLSKFDFGVIEDMNATPSIKLVEGVRCFSCHKNKGPILGNNPWSNTIHNDVVRNTSQNRFAFEVKNIWESRGQEKPELRDDIDGMKVLSPRALEVDAGVRAGADLLYNREIFRVLARTPKGRSVLLSLLGAIVEPGMFETIDEKMRIQIDRLDLSQFLHEATVINASRAPSRLIDFSPAPSIGTVNASGTSWGGSINLIATYDAERAAGKHGLSGNHLPSNPNAFFKSTNRQFNQPSELISPIVLARTIGLTSADRRFLIEALHNVEKSANETQVDRTGLAMRVFEGPGFEELIYHGEIPGRDEFKDKFMSELADAVRERKIISAAMPSREMYTNGPINVSWSNKKSGSKESLPTTSCLRCHDIRAPGKTSPTSPIPPLAFDPFDKPSREAWVRGTDKQRKEVVLSRMLTRIGVDRDMPPEDSLEFKMFRGKNPASFEEVKQFLEAELKKVQGE
jgi:hypothetical protein